METLDPDTGESVFRDWLIDRLSLHLRCDRSRIAVDVPFTEYGLDSVAAIGLTGEIEDEFGIVLEPTAAWDHPTVAGLAALLTTRTGASAGAA
ncbi:acyl carrier protein [Streptomyces capparidis]